MVSSPGPSIAPQDQKMYLNRTRRFRIFSVNIYPGWTFQLDAMFSEEPSPGILAYADIPVVVGTAALKNECLYWSNKIVYHASQDAGDSPDVGDFSGISC